MRYSSLSKYGSGLAVLLGVIGINSAHSVSTNYFGSIYALDTVRSEQNVNGEDRPGRDISFSDLSLFGVNLHHRFNGDLSFHGQVIAYGDTRTTSRVGAWGAQVDYLQINKSFSPSVELTFGRQIFPTFIYSKFSDIGYELPYIELPYNMSTISPIKSVNAASLTYRITRGLTFRPLIGEDTQNGLNVSTADSDLVIHIDNILGFNLGWTNVGEKFKAQITYYQVDLDIDIQSGGINRPLAEVLGSLDAHKALNYSASLYMNFHPILFTIEAGRSTIYSNSLVQLRKTGGYLLFGYNYNNWLFRIMPSLFKDSLVSQTDYAMNLGVNYTLTENYLLKFEVDHTTDHRQTSVNQFLSLKAGVDFVF